MAAVKEAIIASANISVQNDSVQNAIVAKVWVLASYLLRSEHADGNPIVEHGIGGAYEVASHGSKFGKFSDVGHISYNVTVRGNGHIDIGNPMFALRLRYWDDMAIVRSVRIDAQAESGIATIPDNRLQVVPKCRDFLRIQPRFPHYLSLNAIHTFHSFHIIFDLMPGSIALACMLETHIGGVARLVNFLDPNRGIGLTYSPDSLDRMRAFLALLLMNPTPPQLD